MAIRTVKTHAIPYELPPGLFNPFQRWEPRRTMAVISVEDDSGLVGVAQCMGPEAVVKALAEGFYAPRLIREDPFRSEGIWNTLYNAAFSYLDGARGTPIKVLGAIDNALWDLRGQLLGRPIHELLGGDRPRVLGYASAGLYGAGKSLDDLAGEMLDYVKEGYLAVKMKVAGVSLEEDVQRVAAIREAVGPSVKVMVDGCYSLTAKAAVQMADALEPYHIEFFEAPVALEHPSQMAEVRRLISTPVAGYEIASTRFAFRDMMVGGCVDIVQPNPTTAGGITETRRIIAMASSFGLPCSLQCSGELEVITGLHLAAAFASVTSVEVHMIHRYLPPTLSSALLTPRDGLIQAPAGPGLGISDRAHLMSLLQDV